MAWVRWCDRPLETTFRRCNAAGCSKIVAKSRAGDARLTPARLRRREVAQTLEAIADRRRDGAEPDGEEGDREPLRREPGEPPTEGPANIVGARGGELKNRLSEFSSLSLLPRNGR